MAKIKVLSKEITIQTQHEEDYISLTDIARYKDAERTDYLIHNWLRNRNTIEFLGIWEHLNNPGFNPIEFDGIRKMAGLNSFIRAEHGPLRHDGERLARQQSGQERKYPGRCGCFATGVPVQPGEPERVVHPGERTADGTASQVESDRHSPNETADGQPQRQAA